MEYTYIYKRSEEKEEGEKIAFQKKAREKERKDRETTTDKAGGWARLKTQTGLI